MMKSRIIPILILFVGIGLTSLGTYQALSTFGIAGDRNLMTHGEVVDFGTYAGQAAWAVVQFRTEDGRDIKFDSSYSGYFLFSKGERIRVRYNRADPEDAIVADFRDALVYLFYGIGGVAACFLGVNGLRKGEMD